MSDKENVPEEETESQRRERWMRMEEEKEQKREQKKKEAERLQRLQEESEKLRQEKFDANVKGWVGLAIILCVAYTLANLLHWLGF